MPPLKRGPLWDDFKELLIGRRVSMNGRNGTISSHCMEAVAGGFKRVLFKVWFDDRKEELFEEQGELDPYILDEFDELAIDEEICEQQKNNWWPVGQLGTCEGDGNGDSPVLPEVSDKSRECRVTDSPFGALEPSGAAAQDQENLGSQEVKFEEEVKFSDGHHVGVRIVSRRKAGPRRGRFKELRRKRKRRAQEEAEARTGKVGTSQNLRPQRGGPVTRKSLSEIASVPEAIPQIVSVEPAEKRHRRRSLAWLQGPTGRVYPSKLCCQPGDKDPLKDPYDSDAEFKVDRVIDERETTNSRGQVKKEYLLKYKGWKLNPGTPGGDEDDYEQFGDWLEDDGKLASIPEWKTSKPAYFTDQEHINGDWFLGPSGEKYPRSATISSGDRRFVAYKKEGDFPATGVPVERILQQRSVGEGQAASQQYLVKYKGYELPPWKTDAERGSLEYGNWIDEEHVPKADLEQWRAEQQGCQSDGRPV